MIKGKDIVILSIQPWDIEIGSNCKNIALEFAKENRVLYVNPPMDRITRIKQKHSERIKKRIRIAKSKETDIVKLEDNLWNLYPKDTIESINWINSNRIFDVLNYRNSKNLSKNIKSAIKCLGFSDFIFFNDSSMFLGLHLKELLQPQLYTYYMRDYLVKVSYWKKHGERIEPKLIAQADVVLNNSTLYAEYGSQFNQKSIMVGQGCDIEMFTDEKDQIKVPTEFNNIPSPVIGYVGSLTTLRLDIELLEFIAKKRTDWSIVLVGPEDDVFKTCDLHQLTNVYFLGSKGSNELPSYIKGFDICMNPQLVNEITIGNYPRKIDEYLAMGKPVVATSTKAMEMFNQHVYLGNTKEDYITLIEQALVEYSKDKSIEGIAFAKSHTWENNVKDIYNAIITSTQNLVWN